MRKIWKEVAIVIKITISSKLPLIYETNGVEIEKKLSAKKNLCDMNLGKFDGDFVKRCLQNNFYSIVNLMFGLISY